MDNNAIRWSEALAEAIRDIIDKKGLRVTEVSKNAGYQPNFLTKIFNKNKGRKKIDLDDVENLAKAMGTTVESIFSLAQQKKTLSRSVCQSL